MVKIIVSYRPKKEMDVQKIVINIPSDINIYSDKVRDYCDDYLTDFLGYHPDGLELTDMPLFLNCA